MKTALTLSALTFFTAIAGAATLVPTDPSISGSLGLWLTDAENNFDGTTWSDSSGNGNDASPVGTVGTITYAAPTLDMTTSSVDHNTSSVSFAGSADDLLVATNVFGGSGSNQLTIFVAYHVTQFGGNIALTRPAGIGSFSSGVSTTDHFNLASDPSLRKDNGQISSANYSGVVAAGTPFVRVARMDGNGLDEWFNTTAALNSVATDAGAQFTTVNDNFYLGDLRAGVSVVQGATATSDFSISQVIVFDSPLTDQQIADVNEFLFTPIPEPSSSMLIALGALGILRRRRS